MRSLRMQALIGCGFATALLPAALCASPRTTQDTSVAGQGQTHILANTSDGRVDVAVSTGRATPAEAGPAAITRCSGGRTVCSLVNGLNITIGKSSVTVPQRATLLLADVNRGRVVQRSAGQYELILECGDAAAAYEARLFFDRHGVNRMDIWSPEAGSLEQSTIYKDVSKRFS